MRGSIRQRSGDSWSLQIELDRAAGKRRRRFITVKGSYKDAQKALTKLLPAADAGTLPDPTKQTVGEYMAASFAAAHELSPKTLERYRSLARLQITPHIGDIKLAALRAEHVKAWHGALMATGIAPRTIRNAHVVLSRALTEAVTFGTFAANVASKVTLPKDEGHEMTILSPAEVKVLLNGLRGHSYHPIAALALATGMRRGELLALQWSDIDLAKGIIRVERSLEQTQAGLRVKPPKSTAGKRSVTIAGDAVAMLRDHLRQQRELRLQLGQGGQPVLVFCNVEGDHLPPDSVSRNWSRTCSDRGLPVVPFHALRHTSVSMLLGAGMDVLTVSRRIGHRKASITLDIYGHLIEGSDARAAAALDGLLR